MRFIPILLALFGLAKAIPIDNGVEGEPEIECGPTSITVNFNTRNAFEGHVFVKGLFADDACRSSEGGARVAGITLPFDTCNVRRTRSLEPRGVFVSATVIITFHPKFITKVDRAYTVQCFYMEADKTVSTELEVSMLTTAFQTQVVPMPICRYEILDGGPTGVPIQYAIVGQPVYHKWTCDTETVDTFCMVVHSCYVDDGAGDRVELLDAEGCAIDRYLLRNLEYLTDLMAGQETHVFKYADRAQLFFQCQITITIKEPNAACVVPSCAEPAAIAVAVRTRPTLPTRPTTTRRTTPSTARRTTRTAEETTTRATTATTTTVAPTSREEVDAPPPPAPAVFAADLEGQLQPVLPAEPVEGVEILEGFEAEADINGPVIRQRRNVDDGFPAGVMDVLASLDTFEVEDQAQALPKDRSHLMPSTRHYSRPQEGYCISQASFALMLAALICLSVMAAIGTAACCMQRRK